VQGITLSVEPLGSASALLSNHSLISNEWQWQTY